METAAMIGMREIEGRGRALVSLQPLKAGQIVLSESPILLYSALPLTRDDDHDKDSNSSYCSHCFRTLQRHQQQQMPPASCSNCQSLFCSPDCVSIASATSHTPWPCQALTRLRQYHSSNHHLGLGFDLQLQARFLVSAYNLSFVSPPSFQTLLSLQGRADTDDAAVSLHSLISSLSPPPPAPAPVPGQLGFSLEMTALLLAKDKINAFGLMEPFSEMREERSVRAYGIYPLASLFNHDCLPNACRFDYVDSSEPARNNTDIIVRMIHDVPQGREICLSYFPVNLKYSERQKRLKDDYGFICNCDRCKVEANWSDEEEEEDDLEVDNNNIEGEQEDERQVTAVMDEDTDEYMEAEDTEVVKGEDDFPHAYFFLTYMCDRRNCWGTLAPLPPSVSGASSILECNVCGNFKNMDQEVVKHATVNQLSSSL